MKTDGTLACWGLNRNGQASPLNGTFSAVSDTCGVKTDGTLACWGGNRLGQPSPSGETSITRGIGAVNMPQTRDPRDLVVAVSALGPEWVTVGVGASWMLVGLILVLGRWVPSDALPRAGAHPISRLPGRHRVQLGPRGTLIGATGHRLRPHQLKRILFRQARPAQMARIQNFRSREAPYALLASAQSHSSSTC